MLVLPSYKLPNILHPFIVQVTFSNTTRAGTLVKLGPAQIVRDYRYIFSLLLYYFPADNWCLLRGGAGEILIYISGILGCGGIQPRMIGIFTTQLCQIINCLAELTHSSQFCHVLQQR